MASCLMTLSPAPVPGKLIDNRNHPRIRRIRRLHRREGRDATGRAYIEGMRFVDQAVHHHVPIETLVVCPALLTHPFAVRLVRGLRGAGVPVLDVTPAVLHSLALVDDPQGIGAVVRQRWVPLDRARPDAGLCWLALNTVRSPGNLGSILRTAEATGAAGLILLGDSVDPYDPATVRASMGALFGQRLVRTTLDAFLQWKAAQGGWLVGTAPTAPADYHAVVYPAPTVLLMGGERKGLPPALQAHCDLLVRIPMVGQTDSLNLAIATAVILYELFNRRHSAG